MSFSGVEAAHKNNMYKNMEHELWNFMCCEIEADKTDKFWCLEKLWKFSILINLSRLKSESKLDKRQLAKQWPIDWSCLRVGSLLKSMFAIIMCSCHISSHLKRRWFIENRNDSENVVKKPELKFYLNDSVGFSFDLVPHMLGENYKHLLCDRRFSKTQRHGNWWRGFSFFVFF